MECSIQLGFASLNGKRFSSNENICSIARMRKKSLFAFYMTHIKILGICLAKACSVFQLSLETDEKYPYALILWAKMHFQISHCTEQSSLRRSPQYVVCFLYDILTIATGIMLFTQTPLCACFHSLNEFGTVIF